MIGTIHTMSRFSVIEERVSAVAVLCISLFVLAVTVRLLALWEVSTTPFFDVYVGDGRNYHEWALRLAAGEPTPGVFFQAPLYPYFLSGLYRVFSSDPWVPRLAQALLAGGGVVLIALAARMLGGLGAAAIAGGLAALYAPGIFYDTLVHKTGLALFLGSCVAYSLARAATEAHKTGWFFALGASTALAAMCLEHYMAVIAAAAMWLIFLSGTPRMKSLWFAALVGGLLLVQSPLAARNYLVGGQWVVASTSFGMNLWIGNGEGATGTYREVRFGRGDIRFEQADTEEIASQAMGRKVTGKEASNWWFERTLHEMGQNPQAWLAVMGRKIAYVLQDHEWQDGDSYAAHRAESRTLSTLGTVFRFALLGPIFLIGATLLWRREASLRPFVLAGATILGLVAVFYVFGRYRYAAMPAVFIVAGVALSRIRWSRYTALGALAFAPLAIASLWPQAGVEDRLSGNYYSLGVEALNLGRIDDAKALMMRSRELTPRVLYPHFGLATIYRRTGEWSLGEASLRQALRLSPGLPQAQILLGEALLHRGAEHYARGDLFSASAAYREVLMLRNAERADREEAQKRLQRVEMELGDALR